MNSKSEWNQSPKEIEKIRVFTGPAGIEVSLVADGDRNDFRVEFRKCNIDGVDESRNVFDVDRGTARDLNGPCADDPCFFKSGVFCCHLNTLLFSYIFTLYLK